MGQLARDLLGVALCLGCGLGCSSSRPYANDPLLRSPHGNNDIMASTDIQRTEPTAPEPPDGDRGSIARNAPAASNRPE